MRAALEGTDAAVGELTNRGFWLKCKSADAEADTDAEVGARRLEGDAGDRRSEDSIGELAGRGVSEGTRMGVGDADTAESAARGTGTAFEPDGLSKRKDN